jgi:hypothetical protein
MVWRTTDPTGSGTYTSDVFVHSEHTVDVYFIVIGFFTMSDGWINVNTQKNITEKFSSSSVSAIRIAVEFVPLVGLVWSGAWIMATGIVTRVGSDRWPTKDRKVTEEEPPLREDREYEDMLERELQMLEDG